MRSPTEPNVPLTAETMPMPNELQFRTIVSQPFDENSYVVWLSGRSDALVIDPGFDPAAILACLQDEGLTPAALLNTHGHADHIAGNGPMKEAYPTAPLIIGAGDAPMLTDADLNLSAPFGAAVLSPPADRMVREGDVLELAGIRLEVFEIPGHSPGHVVFVHRGPPCVVLGGDVLFRGSIGRYDFPGGDGQRLLDGIRTKLFTLPADTVVYPGHGPVTTVGHERKHNPWAGDSVSGSALS
jgi:glyoxylase-like metal-dependent hydrolase (beta-lactamase superfamily II)